MGGHRHDGAGAVVGQDVVGGVHRDVLARHGVQGGHPEVDAGLLAVGRLPVDVGQRLDLLAVGLQGGHLRGRAELPGQRGVGGHDEEGRAVQGVRTGREHRDRLPAHCACADCSADDEVDVGTDRPADPVLLHAQHPRRPGPAQLVHVLEQPVGVVGHLEEPLRQLALGDHGAAALAGALHDLLVRQHRQVLRAPVHRAALAVGQAPLQEAGEQPLGPAVVPRVAGVQPAGPVEADRVAPEALRLRRDVGVGVGRRVLAALDRGVLRGQTEGVPARRVHHVEAAPHPVARDDVRDRPGLRVPHVEVAAGVGEHVEQVLLLGPRRTAGPVEVEPVPDRQPAVLDGVRVVALALGGDGRDHPGDRTWGRRTTSGR